MSESTLYPVTHSGTGERADQSTQYGDDSSRKILIHNDEVTPYDYVIQILGGVFMLSEEIADHIAWTAHTQGQAVVVVRPRREAEKLVKVAHSRAKQDGFPLTFSLETE